MKTLAIIDLGVGNLTSVKQAFESEILKSNLPISAICTNDLNILQTSVAVILPGVGAFDYFMGALRKIDGLENWIKSEISTAKRPFFCICVGMQILMTNGLENNKNTPGLNLVSGAVKKLDLQNNPVPHVGWNDISIAKEHTIIENTFNQNDVYFTHSYHCDVEKSDTEKVLAYTDYEKRFVSAISFGKTIATQFHPEKSGIVGRKMISNFLKTL